MDPFSKIFKMGLGRVLLKSDDCSYTGCRIVCDIVILLEKQAVCHSICIMYIRTVSLLSALLNWFKLVYWRFANQCLGRAACNVHLVSVQTSQEGIEFTKAQEQLMPQVHSGLCTKTGLAFLAKVANHYYIVLTVFKK